MAWNKLPPSLQRRSEKKVGPVVKIKNVGGGEAIFRSVRSVIKEISLYSLLPYLKIPL
jgi:hypothetical protein